MAAPFELVGGLAAPGVVAFDARGPGGWGAPPGRDGPVRSLLAGTPEVVFAGGLEALDEARRWLSAWRGEDPHAAFLAGYLSYDLGRCFERLPTRIAPDTPDAVPPICLAGYRAAYLHTPGGRGEVVGSDPGARARLAEQIASARTAAGAPAALREPRARASDADYRGAVCRAQDWIRAGDVYQVNLARRLDYGPVPHDELPLLYGALTRRAGAPYSAYLDLPGVRLISNSPERFLRVAGRRIETCPIKGTRPRGRTPEEDAWLAKELRHSAKDLAEHLMIVDLERNDLGRVCRTGSVRVERLFELRSFANVHHLVSSVQGELRDPGDWTSLLAATFPGGSITGAPKLRAMEIIEALEPVRRGVYTGAIGVFDAAGGIDLSIAIRTAVARRGALWLHLGGGIVADSEPEAELAETRIKGRAFAELS